MDNPEAEDRQIPEGVNVEDVVFIVVVMVSVVAAVIAEEDVVLMAVHGISFSELGEVKNQEWQWFPMTKW